MNRTKMETLFAFFREKRPDTVNDVLFDAVFCEHLCRAASAREASIWKICKNSRLILQYGTNVSPEAVSNFSLAMGEGITGAVALSRKTIRLTDAWSTPQHNRHVDRKIKFRTRSMISAPIQYNGLLYGVINILNHTDAEDFPVEWENLLSIIGILYAMTLSVTNKLKGKRFSSEEKHIASQAQGTVIVGVSRAIQDVLDLSMKAARSMVPVLLYGETGTGKELAARKIHENTDNGRGPFLSLNCAAIPETMLESELFGHVKGAFSGAVSDRQGKFVAASGGTLFLDEISEMSQACQAKILRTIQEKTVVPLGSEKEIKYSARIIAATNSRLDQLIRDGKFRQDLYFRLCGLEIHIPRLCNRRDDIPLLVDYFIHRNFEPRGIEAAALPALSPEVAALFMQYAWPGNVRQLEQAIMAALAVCDSQTITLSDLPVWLRQTGPTVELQPHPSLKRSQKSVVESEKHKYLNALEKTSYPGTRRWNVSAAARLLNIPRKTFVYRIKKMEMMEGRQ